MRDNLRQAMGRFATGVTIVTTTNGDEINGMTANALTSVSLEPPLVLVCIDRDNYTSKIISESKIFALNILGADQQELSDLFARPGSGKAESLKDLHTSTAVTGAPLIKGCPAYLDCRVTDIYAQGDHNIFIGEVVKAEVDNDNPPLLFWNGGYRRLNAK